MHCVYCPGRNENVRLTLRHRVVDPAAAVLQHGGRGVARGHGRDPAEDAEGDRPARRVVHLHVAREARERREDDGRVQVGELDYETHAPRLEAEPPRVALAKTVATAPGHQARGLMSAMGSHGVLETTDRYDTWFAAMIRSDNPSRRYTKERHGQERWYALYQKPL